MSFNIKNSKNKIIEACAVVAGFLLVAVPFFLVIELIQIAIAESPRAELASDSSIKTIEIAKLPIKPDPPQSEQPPVNHGKVVYLTFDDGPSANTERILNILDKYNVKGTFFVTGAGQAHNHLIKRAYDSGHAIGLHTFTHNYRLIYSSDLAYFNDLHQIGNMVKDITGVRPALIRFPGGSSNGISAQFNQGIMSRLVTAVREQGYQYFDWNCSSDDATGDNVPVDVIVESSKCWPDQVVLLMHDTAAKNTTVDALPGIIEHYLASGYNILPLTVDSYPAHHRVTN